MQLKRVTPERLAPECVIAENLLAVFQQIFGVIACLIVKGLTASLRR